MLGHTGQTTRDEASMSTYGVDEHTTIEHVGMSLT
jgi:hypothetical protein